MSKRHIPLYLINTIDLLQKSHTLTMEILIDLSPCFRVSVVQKGFLRTCPATYARYLLLFSSLKVLV